jgi:hypothetical protein
MVTRKTRRILLWVVLLGGPICGWLMNGDRGVLFGLAVSVLAIVWLFLEQRKIV